MRVEIGIFFADAPLTDMDALNRYRAHCDGNDSGGPIDPGPHLVSFMSDLTARYPRLESLSDEERANSPWAGAFDAYGNQARITLSGRECANAVELILELADRHGLVCFDPQTRSILTAPPGLHVDQQADKAVWPLTLATLSLALVGVLWLH